jgi:thiol-disulfide isomerase/thioredoxin
MRLFRLIAALTLLTMASASARAAQLPRPSPDFAINLGQGKQARISQYKGKTVVVAFILTYCSHCQKVIGVLSKMQKEYGPRGLQVLASATEDMAATALPGFLRQFDPPFPVGINTTTEFVAYLQHPTMLQLYMPGLVFIDKAGLIQAQYEGRDAFLEETGVEKNIRAKVEEMLTPAAAAPKKAAAKKGTAKKGS